MTKYDDDDWATKAAEKICNELVKPNINGISVNLSTLSEERIAAIIATHAEPLVALLWESQRSHNSWCSIIGGTCNCGADAWNARVDAALANKCGALVP